MKSGSTTRRTFLKGGALSSVAGFFSWGPLAKSAGATLSPKGLGLQIERVPIPEAWVPSLTIARDALKKRGFTIPITSAIRSTVTKRNTTNSKVLFNAESLEVSSQRVRLTAFDSPQRTTTMAAILSWNGGVLIRLEIFEVVGEQLVKRLEAASPDTADQPLSLSYADQSIDRAEADVFVEFLNKRQKRTSGDPLEDTCCTDCAQPLHDLMWSICGIWIFGCDALPDPDRQICIFAVTASCEQRFSCADFCQEYCGCGGSCLCCQD